VDERRVDERRWTDGGARTAADERWVDERSERYVNEQQLNQPI
jgi:hypothetical protein